MRSWPTSVPDYKWPPHFLSPGMAAVRFLLAATFHVAYAFGLLLSLMNRGRERVLVLRTDGLGDGLLFEPALESLARAMSPRVIHLWAPRLTCDLLRLCPAVTKLTVIPRGFKPGNLSYFASFRWRAVMGYELGRWTFDKVIYVAESPEPLGNWIFASARASERWINYGDTINQFDWQRARAHEQATRIIENRPGSAHELLRNEYLASQWSSDTKLRKPKLHLPELAPARAEARVDGWRSMARRSGGSEIVGVVPAASMAINAYPNDRWAAALKQLWEQQRTMPVLLGGPTDAGAIERLGAELLTAEVPFLKLEHSLDLLEMAALVGRLDGLISVDTGLAHLAVAQEVPTVVLVAGGNPGRFFPWPDSPHHLVLNVPMPCAGCNNRCTLAEAECITHIAPEEVAGAYVRLRGGRVPLEVFVAPPRQAPLQAAG